MRVAWLTNIHESIWTTMEKWAVLADTKIMQTIAYAFSQGEPEQAPY